ASNPTQPSISSGHMSTSRSHLIKRLRDLGRDDLLDAIAAREISAFCAAEYAGIVKRQPTLGRGSGNQERRRHYALARATGQVPPLPKPVGPAPDQAESAADLAARLIA